VVVSRATLSQVPIGSVLHSMFVGGWNVPEHQSCSWNEHVPNHIVIGNMGADNTLNPPAKEEATTEEVQAFAKNN